MLLMVKGYQSTLIYICIPLYDFFICFCTHAIRLLFSALNEAIIYGANLTTKWSSIYGIFSIFHLIGPFECPLFNIKKKSFFFHLHSIFLFFFLNNSFLLIKNYKLLFPLPLDDNRP